MGGWGQKIYEAMLTMIYQACNDLINWVMQYIAELITKKVVIDQFIPVGSYLKYSIVLAMLLIVVDMIKIGISNQVDGGMLNEGNVGTSTFLSRVFLSAIGVVVLPWSVVNIMLPINNMLIKIASTINVKFDIATRLSKSTDFMAVLGFVSGAEIKQLTLIVTLQLLAATIGLVILYIQAAIRYIELIICIILAPFAARGFLHGTDAASVWFKETMIVVFTQLIQYMLLQFLLMCLASWMTNPMAFLGVIGTIFAMMKGPRILREKMASSGIASGTGRAASLVIRNVLRK